MGPGLYSDIGKKARDLLYKDYQTDQKFTLTTYTLNGIAISASGTKKNELILGELQSQLKNKNISFDVKATSDSKLLTTVTVDELATPGLRSIFNFIIPDQQLGKVELQYLHDYVGVTAAVGLTANPIVNLSGVVGTNVYSVGADVSFDTATGNFIKCNGGLSVINADLIASLTVNDKGDSINASYYHLVSPLSSTTVGAELTHNFSTNENSLTFGTQHALDPLTIVKARLNNYGKASALIQHEWRPKSFFTISGEIDSKAIEKGAKVKLDPVYVDPKGIIVIMTSARRIDESSGSQFMVNSDGSHGNSLKFGLEETADDDLDEYPQRPGKKRRLTADQVEFLEKNFEVENKLEPERKLQLAKDLGLKPRQVAIWFQNRRARWKAKQLEKGYESLKSSYDSLKLDHDNLLKENEKLQAEVVHLTSKLLQEEKDSSSWESFQLRICPDKLQPGIDAQVMLCKQEDFSSANSAVLESESPQHVDDGGYSNQSQVVGCCGFLRPERHSCSNEFQVEDQALWFWP
ncbi:unnamed protein product [Musa banksii]